jgi:hypothetical protein
MAASGDERRMVFDIRGRRRNVVKVVYAILALLMGLSLFLLAGPGIGGLFSTGNAVSDAAAQQEEQAERIERKLRKNPGDPQQLLNLTRARASAGSALTVVDPETRSTSYTAEGVAQFEKASSAWSEYLKATNEPSPSGAQLVVPALFVLAQTSHSGAETESNLQAVADAQQIVADARPSLGSLSSLAIYRAYSFEYAAAEKARREAAKYATTKFDRENLDNELDEISKRSHELQKQLAEYNKATKGRGKESLENPLGGLGGSSPSAP